MARITVEVFARNTYRLQVSPATLLLPVKGMVHTGAVTIEGSPAALRLLAEQLERAAADAAGAGGERR